ncbi:MAG TPA: NUDIX hydrolase [Gaiellaceae bacterium]|nr:NUDIX hydrolase [Gaiellaceae bacterium]
MDVVRHPESVVVVAVEGDEIVLVRQPRAGANGETLELPAGCLEDGETPEEAAARELEEECGLAAGSWRPLGSFWAAPEYSTERVHVFEATALVRVGPPRLDADEDVAVERAPLKGVIEELSDASSLGALALWLGG